MTDIKDEIRAMQNEEVLEAEFDAWLIAHSKKEREKLDDGPRRGRHLRLVYSAPRL